MTTRMLLAIVPLLTVGVGALTMHSTSAAVPLERVQLRSVEYALAAPAGQAQDQTQRTAQGRYPQVAYRYNDFRYGSRNVNYGYRYLDRPYRDRPAYRYAGYPGYRYVDYGYVGYRYASYLYSVNRYVGYRYAGYRYSAYRYAGYRYYTRDFRTR